MCRVQISNVRFESLEQVKLLDALAQNPRLEVNNSGDIFIQLSKKINFFRSCKVTRWTEIKTPTVYA